ncbi:MAG: hypothetical protein ACYCOU_02685 [Sulfobacillus sp.]
MSEIGKQIEQAIERTPAASQLHPSWMKTERVPYLLSDEVICKMIMCSRADKRELNYPRLLSLCCYYHRFDVVHLLLYLRGSQDVDVNAKCPGHRRSLHYLINMHALSCDQNEMVECARTLVAHGADPVFRSQEEPTVWDFFALFGEDRFRGTPLWAFFVELEKTRLNREVYRVTHHCVECGFQGEHHCQRHKRKCPEEQPQAHGRLIRDRNVRIRAETPETV